MVLDEVLRARLTSLAGSRCGQVRAVLRAEIVLAAAVGASNAAIARTLGVSVNTVLSISAALNVRTGEVLTQPIVRNNAATFIVFLRMLERTINPCHAIHAVLDNGASHIARTTKAWLADHPRWHVHWTPSHASWLNQIELFFSALTRRVLRHGDFPSRDDLIDKMDAYVIAHNTTSAALAHTGTAHTDKVAVQLAQRTTLASAGSPRCPSTKEERVRKRTFRRDSGGSSASRSVCRLRAAAVSSRAI
ncbi:transposase [Streptomyces scopuliridis]|uniref:transposase n=1 Tax=Streptomyces scopuliridis TaxID=452529 RepID=UPI003689D1F1